MPEDTGTEVVDQSLATTESTAIETTTPETPDQTDQAIEARETPGEEIEKAEPQKAEQDKEEDLRDYQVSVAARLRELGKRAPELNAVLQKYPQVRDAISAAFRRESGYREAIPTVAEAHKIRELFPRGMEDIQQTLQEVEEAERVDGLFYNKRPDGSYDHEALVNHLFKNDPQASVAMFERLPGIYAKLVPESYNKTFSAIMGATFSKDGVPDFLSNMLQQAKGIDGADGLVKQIEEMANYVKSFNASPARLTREQEEFEKKKSEFEKQKQDAAKAEGQRFHGSFMAESQKLQEQEIRNHPLIKRLPDSIPEAKKARLVSEIRQRITTHLGKSRSFMNQITPAYNGMDLQKTLEIQRNAWRQPWLLNTYVRRVLNEETPAMTQKAPPAGSNGKPEDKAAARSQPAANRKVRQVNGSWYKPDGTPFSTAEILRGAHLQ